MPPIKINYDISSDAYEQAESSGGVQAPVGLYKGKLTEVIQGYSKNGSEIDKTRPRLECRYQITGEGSNFVKPKTGYATLYDYVSFSEAAAWKLAQFLKAFGVITGPKKGSADVSKFVGQEILIKVSADKDQQGEYRARVGTLLPFSGKVIAKDDDSDDSVSGVELEESFSEDEDSPLPEDEELAALETYDEDQLNEMGIPELREVVAALGIEVPKGTKKDGVIALILESQEYEDAF